MAVSKVRIHCWMAGVVHASGTSSFKDGWGGCRTSARAGGWWGAGSAGAVGALGRAGVAEDRPESLRGVSSSPWA